MMELNQYIGRAFDYEEAGYVEEAIRLCNKCKQAFPEYEDEIELEIAKMNYRNGKEEQALLQFLTLYQKTEDNEIHDLILGFYYGARQKEYEERYQKNCKDLKKYPHFFGDREPSEIRYYPIWTGEDYIWSYDSTEKTFHAIKRCRVVMEEPKDAIFLSSDLLWMEDILFLEKMTRKVNPFMDMENPLLVVYRRETWELLLQLLDLGSLLGLDRIVFYDDKRQLEKSFLEEGVCFPSMMTGDLPEGISKEVNKSYWKMQQEYVEYRQKAAEYYKVNSQAVLEHIKGGRPKILFWTSRFTTILQYHTRDCMQAAERLGCETELCIEKDRLNTKSGSFFCVKRIAQFQPDIIFCIDHFRFEHRESIPEELIWITWVQDPLRYIMDKATPGKLTERDFVMNHMFTSKKFHELGYGTYHLIDAPIPANSRIYKPYKLAEEEKKKYACDICFVCHASDVERHILEEVQRYPEEIRGAVRAVYEGYQAYVYETGEFFYFEEMFRAFVEGAFLQHYGIKVGEDMAVYMAEDMRLWFNQRVCRQALVDWILDAGFTNLKLWGNGWLDNEKYRAYAMGPAENGETLSKIYQASKIVIGNNIISSGAARAWESMLSGAFYMSNYIPPETDVTDIRQIVEINKEMIMFYNREDLIEKLHYYLEHEEERQEMIQRGRKVALEKMTFDSLMKRVLDTVAERLEG